MPSHSIFGWWAIYLKEKVIRANDYGTLVLPNNMNIDRLTAHRTYCLIGNANCYLGSAIVTSPVPSKPTSHLTHLRIREPICLLAVLYHRGIVGYDDPRTVPAISDLLPCTTLILPLRKKIVKRHMGLAFFSPRCRPAMPQHTTDKGRGVPSRSTFTYGTH